MAPAAAASSAERWSHPTHTHSLYFSKTRRDERKKLKTPGSFSSNMAGWSALLLLLVVTASTASSDPDAAEAQQDFVQLFDDGKQAYLDEAWSRCIEKMRGSIDAFKAHKKALVRCRIGCKREAEIVEPLSRVDVEDLQFFDKKVRTTLCLLRCSKENNVKFYKQKVLEEHERLAPYDYLQLCYFQVIF